MADATKNDDETAALREMAANRGCRLVRSRRRKPGGDFGRYGLTDAKTGRKIFGFGAQGLEAKADDVADFLRKRTISTWETSLAATGKGPTARARPRPKAETRTEDRKPEPARRNRAGPKGSAGTRRSATARTPAKPQPEARPPAPPPLRIRTADAVDGEAIAALLDELSIDASGDSLADRIGRLSRMGEPVLVAKLGDEVAGCAAWHALPTLQQAEPLGRITLLAVAKGARRSGIGTALVEAVEKRLAGRGCGQVEILAAEKPAAAGKFARRLGYERSHARLMKVLRP